jgi:transposase
MERPKEKATYYVGVDWSKKEHEVYVEDAAGEKVDKRKIPNSGTGLEELCQWLKRMAGDEVSSVWVAIEVPHGPVVETLLDRGFSVFAINPKQLDRFRDRFTMAGAKDDRLDALVLADSLRTDTHRFRRLRFDEPAIVELREWSRMLGELKGERTRLSNRLRHQLFRYYPQMLEVTSDIDAPWFMELWTHVPIPEVAHAVKLTDIERLLKAHRIRRISAEQVLSILKQPKVYVAPGVTAAATAHIQMLLPRLKMLNEQIRTSEEQLEGLLSQLAEGPTSSDDDEEKKSKQHDVTILCSIPGIGLVVVAALLAEASQPLEERDYHILSKLSGVVPVTRRSAKRIIVLMRRACNKRLRDAMYHWARVAMQHDDASRQYYAQHRQRGNDHAMALRALGDRLLRIACAMLRNGTLYDPEYGKKFKGQQAA